MPVYTRTLGRGYTRLGAISRCGQPSDMGRAPAGPERGLKGYIPGEPPQLLVVRHDDAGSSPAEHWCQNVRRSRTSGCLKLRLSADSAGISMSFESSDRRAVVLSRKYEDHGMFRAFERIAGPERDEM